MATDQNDLCRLGRSVGEPDHSVGERSEPRDRPLPYVPRCGAWQHVAETADVEVSGDVDRYRYESLGDTELGRRRRGRRHDHQDFVTVDFPEAIVGHKVDRLIPRQTVAHSSRRVDEATNQPTIMGQEDRRLGWCGGHRNGLPPEAGQAWAT